MYFTLLLYWSLIFSTELVSSTIYLLFELGKAMWPVWTFVSWPVKWDKNAPSCGCHAQTVTIMSCPPPPLLLAHLHNGIRKIFLYMDRIHNICISNYVFLFLLFHAVIAFFLKRKQFQVLQVKSKRTHKFYFCANVDFCEILQFVFLKKKVEWSNLRLNLDTAYTISRIHTWNTFYYKCKRTS